MKDIYLTYSEEMEQQDEYIEVLCQQYYDIEQNAIEQQLKLKTLI